MDEYTCPKCGAILNNQKGFDPEYGAWRCLRCGQMIMDEYTYNGDLYEIGFNENNVFNNEDYIYYQIFVADNAPMDPNRNVYSSLWIEYGELGYTDGAEPWCLYYDAKKDKWISNESKSTWQYNKNLMDLIMNITPVVNPKTKYVK